LPVLVEADPRTVTLVRLVIEQSRPLFGPQSVAIDPMVCRAEPTRRNSYS
jgi:hypothetical protein